MQKLKIMEINKRASLKKMNFIKKLKYDKNTILKKEKGKL